MNKGLEKITQRKEEKMKILVGRIDCPSRTKVTVEGGEKVIVELPRWKKGSDIFVNLSELGPSEDLSSRLTEKEKRVIGNVKEIYLLPDRDYPEFRIFFKDGREIWIRSFPEELSIRSPGINGISHQVPLPKIVAEASS